MEFPRLLREAVDEALIGISSADLAKAADGLSRRYRAETRDGRPHLDTALAARAYLATRLPATYAAIRSAMREVSLRRPDFAPATLLDAGAGPGTALWAAADCWPRLSDAFLIEGVNDVRILGETLARDLRIAATWQSTDFATAFPSIVPGDLVVLAYVLDELPSERQPSLVDELWTTTRDVLLIVEPGTTNGWRRILSARARLIEAGAHILAPCPHHARCPIEPPDWCHFSRRVARSRLHRQAKRADAPWEDEKYIYLAAARTPGLPASARILAPPKQASGRVALKLCQADGTLGNPLITKRDGPLYKKARRADWGDAIIDTIIP